MSITVEDLRQRMHEHREQRLHIEEVSLGKGFSILAERGLLFLISDTDPDDQVFCGLIEDDSCASHWILFRYWASLLKEAFGELPSRLVEDGSLRST